MKLEQIEIFYYVALWGSFSRAADHLDLSKGYVSKQISQLEKKLKIKLFTRTTRRVTLTGEGKLLLQNAAKIVETKNQAWEQMLELQHIPYGNLTISAPLSMCESFLSDILKNFYNKYPTISLTIDGSNVVKNLSQYAIDVALRLTNIPDENYVARLIGKFYFTICVSPKYLNENGIPDDPSSLINHAGLIYSNDKTKNKWKIGDKEIEIKSVITSNSPTLIRRYLLDGVGIARLPNYMVNEDIASGKLKELFSKLPKEEINLYAIYRSGTNISIKIRYFLDFLAENINLLPMLD